MPKKNESSSEWTTVVLFAFVIGIVVGGLFVSALLNHMTPWEK